MAVADFRLFKVANFADYVRSVSVLRQRLKFEVCMCASVFYARDCVRVRRFHGFSSNDKFPSSN